MMTHEYSVEDIEHARAYLAYVVIKFGNQYAPILERLDKELEAARKNDPQEKARRILEDYNAKGGLKAMRFSQR